MVQAGSVPRWAAHVLDRIDACPFAELTGFVLRAEREPRRRGIGRLWAGLLYRLYTWLDRRRFGSPLDALDEVDISERLSGGLPVLGADADSLTALEDWRLDVVLDFASGSVPAPVLDGARFGVWSYRHGDQDSRLGGAALFWEMYDGAPVSGSVLLRRTTGSSPAGEPIYRSFATPDPISLHRARTRIYWKSAEFAVRKLRDLHLDGELAALPDASYPAPPAVRRRDPPTNRQMLRFGCRLAARVARRKLRTAFGRHQWFIAYRKRGPELPTAETFRNATLLVPPPGRFYADPCLVDWNGADYLFFEEFSFDEQKGSVSCCRLTADGRRTPAAVVLERPYHLSYPFVFFVAGDAFMLPESSANRAIELYKARSFPSEWALEAVLVSDVRAVDPTLIEHDGRYWLFANVAVEGASADDELCLFSARSLHGPWEPHPRNPVVSDVRRARPAGRPFIDTDGRLIRPSQDCSGFYGSAVVFNRIDALTEAEYRETPVGRLGPNWHRTNVGTHTFTCTATWEALDGRAWVAGRTMRHAR